MDDVQNISAPLYGKAEPTTAKTTMSVREMQHLLGLGKTDSYWLLHKNFFEVILINDKMRIVISSFEKWYANQVKYHTENAHRLKAAMPFLLFHTPFSPSHYISPVSSCRKACRTCCSGRSHA